MIVKNTGSDLKNQNTISIKVLRNFHNVDILHFVCTAVSFWQTSSLMLP